MLAEGNLEEKVSFSWFPFLLDVMYDPLPRQPGRSLAPRDLEGGSIPDDSYYDGPCAMVTVPACWAPSGHVTCTVSFGSVILQGPSAHPIFKQGHRGSERSSSLPIGSRWQNQDPKSVSFDAEFDTLPTLAVHFAFYQH